MDRIALSPFVGVILIGSAACAGAMTQEDHRRELLETREAWGRAIAEGNIEEIFSFWTEDVGIYPVGEPAVEGMAAVREYVRRNRQDLGLTPRMTLVEVGASASGDFGHTIGTHDWVDREGIATMPGRYVTLWRKNDQGDWRCFLEIHSPGPSDGVIQTEPQ